MRAPTNAFDLSAQIRVNSLFSQLTYPLLSVCRPRENSLFSQLTYPLLSAVPKEKLAYPGPAAEIRASTFPNFSKFFRNISASFCACAS